MSYAIKLHTWFPLTPERELNKHITDIIKENPLETIIDLEEKPDIKLIKYVLGQLEE